MLSGSASPIAPGRPRSSIVARSMPAAMCVEPRGSLSARSASAVAHAAVVGGERLAELRGAEDARLDELAHVRRDRVAREAQDADARTLRVEPLDDLRRGGAPPRRGWSRPGPSSRGRASERRGADLAVAVDVGAARLHGRARGVDDEVDVEASRLRSPPASARPATNAPAGVARRSPRAPGSRSPRGAAHVAGARPRAGLAERGSRRSAIASGESFSSGTPAASRCRAAGASWLRSAAARASRRGGRGPPRTAPPARSTAPPIGPMVRARLVALRPGRLEETDHLPAVREDDRRAAPAAEIGARVELDGDRRPAPLFVDGARERALRATPRRSPRIATRAPGAGGARRGLEDADALRLRLEREDQEVAARRGARQVVRGARASRSSAASARRAPRRARLERDLAGLREARGVEGVRGADGDRAGLRRARAGRTRDPPRPRRAASPRAMRGPPRPRRSVHARVTCEGGARADHLPESARCRRAREPLGAIGCAVSASESRPRATGGTAPGGKKATQTMPAMPTFSAACTRTSASAVAEGRGASAAAGSGPADRGEARARRASRAGSGAW